MVVVPGKQLPLSHVIVDHAVVEVLVFEWNGYGLPLANCSVVHVVDGGIGCRVTGQSVQLAADDERVGHRGLPDVGLPALLYLQTVWVQLRDHDGSLSFAGGVDGPQALLIHGQVDVGVTSPGVGILAMEASMREVTTRCDVLRAKVIADKGAATTSLIVEGTTIHSGTSALHRIWQQQDLKESVRTINMNDLVLRRQLGCSHV